MSETCYYVNSSFNNKKIIDFLDFYHLGKDKKALCTFYLNGNYATLNSILKSDDILMISYEEDIDFVCNHKHIDILYEDEHILIINKPAGIMVHPDDKLKDGTLSNYVAGYYEAKGIRRSVKYLHRIDTMTSGCVIFAKDILTQSYYNYLISNHEIKRTYLLVCKGILEQKSGTINLPIGKDRHVNGKRRVSDGGQNAITHYKVLKYAKNNSVVEASLETGRNHQIRVHFAHIGHPLLGDMLYGGPMNLIQRQALHSYRLSLKDAYTNEDINIEAPIPKDILKLL